MDSFRKFFEEESPGMLSTLKKQERIPKKLWFGMPFSVGANKTIKLNGKLFKGPMTFYVTDFDNATVTMKLVNNPMDFSNDMDPDDEIDTDNMNDGGEQQFIIPRQAFEKLLEPDNIQGSDYASASQAAMTPR